MNMPSIQNILLLAAPLVSYADGSLDARCGRKYVPRAPGGAPAMSAAALTTITPLPGAEPIPITRQSQVVNVYVPLYTLCPLDAVAQQPAVPFVPFSNVSHVPRQLRPRASGMQGDAPIPQAEPTAAPVGQRPVYINTTVVGPNGCLTQYEAFPTTVCATTLLGIGTQVTVTACSQTVTFSSDLSFSLITGADGSPAVETTATNFIAPWQSLTDGIVPSTVTKRVCSDSAGATPQCVDYLESWSVQTLESVHTTTNTVDFTTQIPGPSKLIVNTLTTNVPEAGTTLSISTQKPQVKAGKTVSTIISTLSSGALPQPVSSAGDALPTFQSTSTNTITVTVFRVSSPSVDSEVTPTPVDHGSENTTITTTIHSTSTEYITETQPSGGAVPS